METKRLQLVNILATRDSTVTKDGLLTNCYKESTPIGDMIIKRPGYSIRDSFGVGCAQGGITYDGQAIWVIADALVTGGAGIPVVSAFSSLTTPPKPTAASSVGTAAGGYMVSHGGALYHIGGRDNGDTQISVYKSIDDGTSWSTLSTPWTTTAIGNNGSNRATGNLAVSFGGKIYALGIIGTRNIQSSPDGVTWTQETADLAGSGSLFGCALIVHNSLLYAFLSSTSGAFQIWTSSNGSVWSALNSGVTALAGRVGFCAWSLNGKLYVGTGHNGTTVFNDIYVSSDNGANFVLLVNPAAFAARFGASAWVLQDRIWIGGGQGALAGGQGKNDVWGASDGSAWLQGAASTSWTARWAASTAVHNSKLFIGPGTNSASNAIVAGLFSATVTNTTSIPLTPPPATSCLPFQMTLIPATLTTPTAVFLKNNEVAYYYNGLSVVQITDPDYPPETVFGVVYLDGTVYVMNRRGVIFGSDLNAPTSWSALNFISANAEADAAVALVRQLNYVVALKDYSTEFFYDAGNATGSPLAKVLNALLEIGCASAGSIAFSDNTFYFMANSRQKGRSIMKMEGYTPKYISNQYIDRILNADDLAEVYAFVIKTNGHFFYVLTLVSSNVTLVLDEVTGEWHLWSHMAAAAPVSVVSAVVQSDGSILATASAPHGQLDGNVVDISGATPGAVNGQFNIRYDTSTMSTSQFSYVPATPVSGSITGTILATFYTESFFPGVYYAKGAGEDLLLDIDTGDVYTFDPDLYQDAGLPIDVLVRTLLNDFGLMATKRFSRFELVGDKVETNVLVRYSDNDYQSWSLFRTIPMAQNRAKLTSLGSGRRRAFEVRHTQNFPLRLMAAEVDLDLGAF
jgi:hypothetical protein